MTDKGIRPHVCSVCGAPGYAKGMRGTCHEQELEL